MSTVEWLCLRPRDALLVRDGRQFGAGTDARAESVYPWPSTLAGAVGAAFGAEPDTVRGPIFAQQGGAGGWQPYFPTPADVIQPEDDPHTVRRLMPRQPEAVTDLASVQLPQLPYGDGEAVGGWLPGDWLSRYLHGEAFNGDGEADRDDLDGMCSAPLVPERRVGLARERGRRVAAERLLYDATYLRPQEGWGLLAACEFTDGWQRTARGPVRLGGKSRLCDVEAAGGIDWPEPPSDFPGGRVLVYLATPAIWPDGWPIPLPPGAELLSAVVPPALAVATASPAGARLTGRVLRWAVPAGSVYHLRFPGPQGPEAARTWAHTCHGQAYGRPDRDRLRTAGFGVVLTGVWS